MSYKTRKRERRREFRVLREPRGRTQKEEEARIRERRSSEDRRRKAKGGREGITGDVGGIDARSGWNPR
jgi:hypothetical protein